MVASDSQALCLCLITQLPFLPRAIIISVSMVLQATRNRQNHGSQAPGQDLRPRLRHHEWG